MELRSQSVYTYHMSNPFFSIIIPTRNEEDTLPRLLACIAAQTYTDYEVIISDSHSTDGTKTQAEAYKATLPAFTFYEGDAHNVGAARNSGASIAQGKWLVFLDADVTISPLFLKHMARHIAVDSPTMTTVWNVPIEKNKAAHFIFFLMNCAMSMSARIKPVMNGPCMFMQKDLFDHIHGFDETIVFGEDYEIARRASRQGARFQVYRTPQVFISVRRVEKEGALSFLFKALKALIYQFLIGPIRKPIFTYEMGGQYFKNSSSKLKSKV